MPIKPANAADAEEKLLWNSDESKCPGQCFRPVGLAIDGKQRLFMTSDSTGELYVVTGTRGIQGLEKKVGKMGRRVSRSQILL